MRAVVEDKDWWTKNVLDGQPNEKLRARDLMMKIADSTWHCGDPGMQYDTTVNRWHTSKNTARINASRSEEHTSELQSRLHLVCRLLLEKKNKSFRSLQCCRYS